MSLRMPQFCPPAELWAVYRIHTILSRFSVCSVTWFTCTAALTYFGSLHLVSAQSECLQTEIDEHLSQALLTPGINTTARSHVTRLTTSCSHDFQLFLTSHYTNCLSCVPCPWQTFNLSKCLSLKGCIWNLIVAVVLTLPSWSVTESQISH